MAMIVAALVVVGGMCDSAFGAGQQPDNTAVEQVVTLGPIELLVLAAFPLVLWWLWRADVIRPDSLARHRKRLLTDSPWWVWWAGAVLMLFAQTTGGAMGVMLFPPEVSAEIIGPPLEVTHGATATDVAAALGGGTAALATGIWLLWFLRTSPWGLSAGLDLRPRIRDLLLGLIGLLATLPIMAVAMVCSALAALVLTGESPDQVAHETLKTIIENPGSPRTWGLIVAAVVLAPIVEEVLFRGLLQSAILRLTHRVWPSVLAASLIFGAVHIGAASPHAIVPLFVFGVCLGVAYERTGRLWVPVAMHMLFNGLNILQALLM